MNDIIRVLPDSVANQIAAGEVIQRPASVVKELVENAVDAGATDIQVIVKDAGRTLIQVVDNGKGMSITDARLAFERHATSKINDAGDLFALHTMGFRGEALASIAAVAQIEMQTARREDSLGTHIRISGSKVESQEPAAVAPGTNLMVKNLFFNVPARRKFLKKDAVELSNISHEFERLALVNPMVELTLIHNGNIIHQLLPGSLKLRIGSLFGKGVEKQLIPVETETSLVKISGFVGLPENARKRGALQYFFVNGRNMLHPYFRKAVMHCYEQLIRPDEQPNYFLNFEVDPATIDVNIHPTKSEIKFENEQPIWQILVAAIKESLGRYNAVPSMDFNIDDAPEIPAFNPSAAVAPGPIADVSYNPFASQNSGSGRGSVPSMARKAVDDWEKLYRQFSGSSDLVPSQPELEIESRLNRSADEKDDVVSKQNELTEETQTVEMAPTMIQLKNKYLLSQGRNGLLLIDQHRAHVRILYERFSEGAADSLAVQKVMFPEIVTLNPEGSRLLENILPQMESLGFELSFLGDNSWAVNGVPAVNGLGNSAEIVQLIVNDMDEETDMAADSVKSRVALNLARRCAIPSGQPMSEAEMESLTSELFSLSTPAYTPDGLKIVTEIALSDIEKLFAR